MTKWEDKLGNSGLIAEFEEMEGLIPQVEDILDEDDFTEFRRFKKVFKYCKEIIEQIDPELIPSQFYSLFNKNNAINNSLRQFISTKNSSNITAASNGIDVYLNNINNLAPLLKRTANLKPLKGLEELTDKAIEKLKEEEKSLKEKLSKLDLEIKNRKKQIETLDQSLESKKSQIDNFVNDWQEKFASSQESRSTSFNDELKDKGKKYDEWYSKTREEVQKEIDSFYKSNSEKSKVEYDSFNDKITKFIESANGKHNEIINLYQLVAKDSVAGGHESNAEKEKKSANIWRWGVIGSVVVIVVWNMFSHLVGFSITNEKNELDIYSLVKSLTINLVTFFVIGYSSKQSAMHRKKEHEARKFALETQAFDPFISSLEKTERDELKVKITEHLFKANDSDKNLDISKNDFDISDKTLTKIVELIKAFKDK